MKTKKARPYSRLGPIKYSAEYEEFKRASHTGGSGNLDAARRAHSARFPGMTKPKGDSLSDFEHYVRRTHHANMGRSHL